MVNKILIITSIICLTILGTLIGHMQYNYEINKCNNLDSKESDYDFDHKIEIDANYNSNCYFLNEHPLSYASQIIGAIIITILAGVSLVLVIILINQMINLHKEMGY